MFEPFSRISRQRTLEVQVFQCSVVFHGFLAVGFTIAFGDAHLCFVCPGHPVERFSAHEFVGCPCAVRDSCVVPDSLVEMLFRPFLGILVAVIGFGDTDGQGQVR